MSNEQMEEAKIRGQAQVFCCMRGPNMLGMQMMKTAFHYRPIGLGLCVMLSACAAVQKKNPAFDLYELHPVAVGVPADYDSYYTPPKSASACSTINESPSCNGN